MSKIDMTDGLQERFQENLPKVDADRGWDRLQTRLTEEPGRSATGPTPGPGPKRPRRRAVIVAVAAGAALVVVALVVVAALGLFGGEDQVALVDPTGGRTSTEPAVTGTTIPSGEPTTTPGTVPDSTTTSTVPSPLTTSQEWAARSKAAQLAAEQLGDAVVAYFREGRDLTSVQSLVASSAQEGLTQILASLVEPTDCKVTRAAGSDSSNVVQVVVLFADGKSQQPEFTLAFDSEENTITAIVSGRSWHSDSVSPPTLGAEPNYMYLGPSYSYYTAQAVVLGTVVEVLPLRRNPLAGMGNPASSTAPQPVIYKGYVLQVEKAYGPNSIPERITIYALGNGTVVIDGKPEEVREELPLDASVGDRLLVPLMKMAYFGTPELGSDEYWVQANWAVFAVDGNGHCTRVTGTELDPESGHEFELPYLEHVALEKGKQPSLIE